MFNKDYPYTKPEGLPSTVCYLENIAVKSTNSLYTSRSDFKVDSKVLKVKYFANSTVSLHAFRDQLRGCEVISRNVLKHTLANFEPPSSVNNVDFDPPCWCCVLKLGTPCTLVISPSLDSTGC